jgi:hypothetical protein
MAIDRAPAVCLESSRQSLLILISFTLCCTSLAGEDYRKKVLASDRSAGASACLSFIGNTDS